jgi:hypothetical protein
MPKTGTKLTTPLYNYVTPRNYNWVRTSAEKKQVGHSKFMNTLINYIRRHRPHVVTEAFQDGTVTRTTIRRESTPIRAARRRSHAIRAKRRTKKRA